MTCPADIHRAFSEILYWTMLEVRGSSADKDYCFALADHAHNIPHLIDRFDPKRFFYYWECERECFVRALERQDRKPHSRLAHEWTNLEPLYRAMRANHHVAPAIVMEVETGLCEVALNQEHIERLLDPARGIPQFRVLDCECSERVLSLNEDGTYTCEAKLAEPEEIMTKLLLFGRSNEGFDPTELQGAQYARDMFAASLKQEAEQ